LLRQVARIEQRITEAARRTAAVAVGVAAGVDRSNELAARIDTAIAGNLQLDQRLSAARSQLESRLGGLAGRVNDQITEAHDKLAALESAVKEMPQASPVLASAPPPTSPAVSPIRSWYERFRPDAEQVSYMTAVRWPADAPRFSILMPVYNVRSEWLQEAIRSVCDQIYPDWELICVNDASTEGHIRRALDWWSCEVPRIKTIHLERNVGTAAATNVALAAATGDYVCFLDQDDVLERHALYQFASAVCRDRPDLIYSDEIITGESIDDLRSIQPRCAFSYDYYLSHPYFVHLVGVRTELARAIGGCDETLTVSHDVDFVLRVLESCKTVGYVPDVLYRWRTHGASAGHTKKEQVRQTSRGAIEAHLRRIGADAEVIDDALPFNFRDVRFKHAGGAKVAILIPTKNQVGLLSACVESLKSTVRPGLADVVVVDHDSDDAATREYLAEFAKTHMVTTYHGGFNFAAIMNHAAAFAGNAYTHYLLLNDDTMAIEPGWLEHMLGFGRRPDVGIVGATLLYPEDTLQHAGVVVGMFAAADHAYKFWKLRYGPEPQQRQPGHAGTLVSNRDYSAVTAACLLIRSDVFAAVSGFDERFAVGFNDVDLCLRVRERGYKVIRDAHAVLYHHESRTRGANDGHPNDTALFCRRYAAVIRDGDPYYSPLLSRMSPDHGLCSYARSQPFVRPVTIPVVLPTASPAANPATLPLDRAA
jgi:GT2 family glycosyltransferase